jgi:hypothetical protein
VDRVAALRLGASAKNVADSHRKQIEKIKLKAKA